MRLEQHSSGRAFAFWLRTGRLPSVRTDDGVELKFNPYHDPTNGQFTFAPGGGSGIAKKDSIGSPLKPIAKLTAGRSEPPVGRGSNARAFEDPMTLEQSFPSLQSAPGGAIIAVADNFFNIAGPATEAQAALLEDWSSQVIADVKTVDPSWRHDALGPITTIQGCINELNSLRLQRAVTLLRVRADADPLKVETLRYVQARTDAAYEEAKLLLRSGRLRIRLSKEEAIGNYIDRRVRLQLREDYNLLGIDSAGAGPVRVNRRENIKAGGERSYRRPDARVDDVAFDVTLSRKTLATPQVRGFFDADFKPSRVVIIRPSQLGSGHTYVIQRPKGGR